MARSPFTLAAAVTAAVPGAEVTGARELSTHGDGRFDSAVVTLNDQRELTIRVASDEAAARELASEALALRSLSDGARAMLPFRVSRAVGEALLGDDRLLVADFLPGYQIEAGHVPAGPGAATSLGKALAAIHALPASVVRQAGLPDRDAAATRAELRTLIDRAAATGRLPARLISRWLGAMNDDELWQFGATVTLGGAQSTAFLFEDDDVAGPEVVGVIGWHGLSVGDPAADLAWLSSAPEAAEDIHRSYVLASERVTDGAILRRGRLHAELDFARWLLHGEELRRSDIIDDAAALLEALAENVREHELSEINPALRGPDTALQSALGAAERVPTGAIDTVDTSMQTDTYTAEGLWVAPATSAGLSRDDTGAVTDITQQDTEPFDPLLDDLDEEGDEDTDAALGPADSAKGSDDAQDAQRAARAAFQRWTNSSSE